MLVFYEILIYGCSKKNWKHIKNWASRGPLGYFVVSVPVKFGDSTSKIVGTVGFLTGAGFSKKHYCHFLPHFYSGNLANSATSVLGRYVQSLMIYEVEYVRQYSFMNA